MNRRLPATFEGPDSHRLFKKPLCEGHNCVYKRIALKLIRIQNVKKKIVKSAILFSKTV